MAAPVYDYDLILFLRWMELNLHWLCPVSLKAEVKTLQLKVNFLLVFLSCGGRHNSTGNRHLQALLGHIRTVFQSLDLDIGRCWLEFNRGSSDQKVFSWLPTNMDDLFSRVLQRLELLKTDIHEVYIILCKSSRSTIGGDSKRIRKNLESLLTNTNDLLTCNAQMLAPVEEELKSARISLRFLTGLLAFTAKKCNKQGKLKDLIIHAEFLAEKMSCLLFLCSFKEKMNEEIGNEMKMYLSSEIQKLSPTQPDVREIYIKVLKASKSAQGDSAMVDELDRDFLESLQHHMHELPDTKFGVIASNRDEILNLLHLLQFLTELATRANRSQFLESESTIPKLDQVSNYFPLRFSAIIIDMGCLVYLLHDKALSTDKAMELKLGVSNLIKIANEDAIKVRDKYITKSWHLKTMFRRTTVDYIIRALIEIVPMVRPLCSPLFKVLKKEMLSLYEAFINMTSRQYAEPEELQIPMMRLKNVRNEIESLIATFSQNVESWWSHNLWMFTLIEEIKTIKTEFKDLQEKMVQDSSASNLPGKVAEGNQTAIGHAVISEEEEKIGEQVIHRYKRANIFSTHAGIHGIEDQLRWLETNLDFICPLKDEINALRFTVSFLKLFLSCKGNWNIEHGKLDVLLKSIHSVFQNVNHDLQKLWVDMNLNKISTEKRWCLPMNMDCLLSSVFKRFQLLKPCIQEVYTILSKSTRLFAHTSGEAVMENLKSLLKNIEDLLRCNIELVCPVKEQLEAVQKYVAFLRNFLGFTTKRCSKLGRMKDLLIHAERLAKNMSCLLFLVCIEDQMNDQIVNELKMHLLYELQKISSAQADVRKIYIRSLKASNSTQRNCTVMDEFDLGFLDSLHGNVLELSNNNFSVTTSNIDKILSLHEELKFLITFLAVDQSSEGHFKQDQTSNYLFDRINALLIETGCAIYLLNDELKNKKISGEADINRKVTDLVEKFMIAKADIRKVYEQYVAKSLRFNFPRTNAHGFIGSFFQNLMELLNSKADLVTPLKYQIEIVQKELLSLREDFDKITMEQSEELQSQWNRFVEIAYQAEYVIDSFLARDQSLCCHKLGMFNIIDDIRTIKVELKAIKSKTREDSSLHKLIAKQISVESTLSGGNLVLGYKRKLVDKNGMPKLVLFGEEGQKIREKLTNGGKKLRIISIVGMPGIGKTTLANSVFEHSSVIRHFHVQARCSVSQVHDRRRLLREILQQLSDASENHSDEDLDEMLHQSLKGRRYLILMDDIWSIQSWKDIKASFPDDENGSRILWTSRFGNIVQEAGLESTNYHLPLLSEEKCWDMLKVKLFGNGICPPDLEMVGREIASNCKGLPLTVDLIGGVLRVSEKKDWKKVSENMVTILLADSQGQCRKVLELSYQNLPDDLKPCFLYFAAFPEDEDVPTRNLISLWIAEGFVQHKMDEVKSLEDQAEDMLNNLINRCLVTVSKRKPIGRVDTSRVHDLLHDFVVTKAQEESFMLKIDGNAQSSTSSTIELRAQWREQYRICIYSSDWVKFLESNASGSRTRSLICTFSIFSSFSLNLSDFKLLRVLHITRLIRGCSDAVFTMIHLRVLAIDTCYMSDAHKIISKIDELQNLENFTMGDLENFIMGEPRMGIDLGQPKLYLLLDKVCNMLKLRNFCFGPSISFRYHSEKIWTISSPFKNLRTFYRLSVGFDEDIEKLLKLMPNLVELKVSFYGLVNKHQDIYPFPRLDFLWKLESLEVKISLTQPFFPFKDIVNFPPFLKKLVLINFALPWTKISEIGNLEYLEILELKDGAFQGPIWEMVDGQFPKLKYLKFKKMDIQDWIASEDHLSFLEELHLRHSPNLNELPSCLAEVATLQVMKLADCSFSANISAQRIKEEQEETGNEQLVVEISHPWWRKSLIGTLAGRLKWQRERKSKSK